MTLFCLSEVNPSMLQVQEKALGPLRSQRTTAVFSSQNRKQELRYQKLIINL